MQHGDAKGSKRYDNTFHHSITSKYIIKSLLEYTSVLCTHVKSFSYIRQRRSALLKLTLKIRVYMVSKLLIMSSH